MRIGQGSDLHRLTEISVLFGGETDINGKPCGLWLGGEQVFCQLKAVAHSDGDVLLHACTDAILGAAAAGDIGRLFPDTANENRGRPSVDFVRAALKIAREKGLVPVNLDATVHLQRPKLAPHMGRINASLAKLLGLPVDCVNVKAKTGEDLGDIGQGLAVAADAVVLMRFA